MYDINQMVRHDDDCVKRGATLNPPKCLMVKNALQVYRALPTARGIQGLIPYLKLHSSPSCYSLMAKIFHGSGGLAIVGHIKAIQKNMAYIFHVEL